MNRQQWIRRVIVIGIAAAAVAILGGLTALILALWVIVSVTADRPVTYESITEHFKYGSIGSEPGGSLLEPVGGALPPYAVFTALPSICPEKLPGGYASLGLVFEAGKDLPVGVSRRRRLGVDQVGFNCALCHTSTLRDSPASAPRVVLGMPAHELDLQRLIEFVLDCTLDNRTTAASVLGHAPERPPLFERLLLNFGLIDRLKIQTLALRNRIAPIMPNRADRADRARPGDGLDRAVGVPRWGRGRVDTFNPYKAIQFNWRLDDLPADELIGAADFPSLWNQRPRQGLHLHWDGDNDSVDERNLSAALGAGVTPVTVDHAALKRVRDWIWTLPPPKYPYPIDPALAERGAGLYERHCLECHAGNRFRDGDTGGGRRVGEIEDIDRIGTDPHRLNSYTSVFAANQYALYPESPYRFTHFRKTRGYANQPLDGIWLRGPYLHNGSVPNLRDLLEPPDRRPSAFYRGYDVFDQANVGFVSNVAEEHGVAYFRYDTTLPGNGNGGHEYGTMLPEADKRAIVEYLKTF